MLQSILTFDSAFQMIGEIRVHRYIRVYASFGQEQNKESTVKKNTERTLQEYNRCCATSINTTMRILFKCHNAKQFFRNVFILKQIIPPTKLNRKT